MIPEVVDHTRSFSEESDDEEILVVDDEPELNLDTDCSTKSSEENTIEESSEPIMESSWSEDLENDYGVQGDIESDEEKPAIFIQNRVWPERCFNRGSRSLFTPEQLQTMQSVFLKNTYPTKEQYECLSLKLSIDEKRMKLWFQNKRAKMRKCGPIKKQQRRLSNQVVPPTQTPQPNMAVSVSPRPLVIKPETPSPVKAETEGDKTVVTPRANETAKKNTEQFSSTTYQAMTVMSLPPDHPFCNLVQQQKRIRPKRQNTPDSESSLSSAPSSPISEPRPLKRSRKCRRSVEKSDSPPQVNTYASSLPVPPLVSQLTAMNYQLEDTPLDLSKKSPKNTSPKSERNEQLKEANSLPMHPIIPMMPLAYQPLNYYARAMIWNVPFAAGQMYY